MSYEVIDVLTEQVACDGGGGALGHPRVYLHTDPDNNHSVTCGYCSRTYVLRTDKVA
jgi:uncharacterized Zn-finger protein